MLNVFSTDLSPSSTVSSLKAFLVTAIIKHFSWCRHQMETFSALLAICAGNSPAIGEFSAQRPVARNFNVFFNLRLNKRLSKQTYGWRFETPSRLLWCYCNVNKFTGFISLFSSHVSWSYLKNDSPIPCICIVFGNAVDTDPREDWTYFSLHRQLHIWSWHTNGTPRH